MRRTVLVAALAAAAVPATPALAAEPHFPCANADIDPLRSSREAVRHTTLCLINVHRRRHGRVPLRASERLTVAGQRHARDMVQRRYFAHASRTGAGPMTRIRRTGYLGGGVRGMVGENLAWGSGVLATPRRIVRAWMASPGHRANILRPEFRQLGVGVVDALPVGGHDGATYAAEFGRAWR